MIFDEDVPTASVPDKFHFVTQAIATTPDNSESKVVCIFFLLEQVLDLTCGVIRDRNKVFVTKANPFGE